MKKPPPKRRPKKPGKPGPGRTVGSLRDREAGTKAGAEGLAALVGDFTALDAAGYVRAVIAREGQRLSKPGARMTDQQRRKLLETLVSSATKLGQITGETLEVSDDKWCKLPATRRMVARIVEALRAYPEAAGAVADVLEATG